jgi:tripartite-type tricarboxylate transporter receptor subunit TctC
MRTREFHSFKQTNNKETSFMKKNLWIARRSHCWSPAATAMAQGFLSAAKPIRLIVGYPPGGGIDFAGAHGTGAAAGALKQQLVVDYKPGASGMIAATELTRQPADGYTLLLANTGPFAIAPYLQSKPPYDPIKQFTYIGQISQGSYIAVTRPDHPAKNLKEFVAWAKGQPGKVNFASGGNGTSTHLNGELMNQVTGLDMTHVPYKGSAPAVQDLIGGQTQILIDAGSVLLPQVKGGKLKALAVTGPVRDPQLPDVPTVKELGLAGMEAVGFQGLVGPAGMPKEVVDKLSGELAKALAQPHQGQVRAAGAEVHSLGPVEFAAFVKADNEKWSRLIKERKLQLD